MEQSFQTEQKNTPTPQQETLVSLNNHEEYHHVKNVYPTMRHFTLTVLVLLGVFVILFLVHQNGKSIYENGL